MATMLRDVYPTISTDHQGLMRHATSEELIGMKATPSNAVMTFFLNTIDIDSRGIASTLGNINSKMVQISKGTKIYVDDLVFSTTNNIRVHFDGTNSIVEQMNSDDEGLNRIGSIPSYIIADPNLSSKWIRFDVHVRQFNHYTIDTDVIGTFKRIIPYDDSIWYLTATGLFKDGERNLEITYSDINYDKNLVTLRVTDSYNEQHGRHLIVELPNIYMMYEPPKRINIVVHTTKGEMDRRLIDFKPSDFKIVKMVEDYELANVEMQVISTGIINGGSNAKTLDEIRESIINNVTGPLKAPVTKAQLEEKARRDGYEISLYSDMVTHRLFTVSKNISTSLFSGDSVVPNIFLNETHLNPSVTNNNILYKYGAVIVKNETIFITKNGLTLPATDIGLLNTYTRTGGYDADTLSRYLTDNSIFFTPYTNIIYDDYQCSTFDLHDPEIDKLEILNRNIVPLIVNIDEITITTIGDEFHIEMTIAGLDTVDLLLMDLRAQLVIEPFSSSSVGYTGERLYFDNITQITKDNNKTNFIIPMESYVDKLDNILLKGDGNVNSTFVELRTNAKVYLYVPQELSMTTNLYAESGEIRKGTGVFEVTGLTTQSMRIRFGRNLHNMFNETSYGFTARKYKKYTDDIPYFHDEDIYALDEDCSSSSPLQLLHAKGDVKLDSNKEVLYQHRAGDSILEDGLPIVDTLQGIMIKSNILMLEFEYLIARTRRYNDVLSILRENIKQFLEYCDVIGANRLESTNFKYKPNMVSNYVLVEIGGQVRNVKQSIKPDIKLYIEKNANFELDIPFIGRIIHEHLDKEVVRLDEIRDALVTRLGVRTVSMRDLGIGYETEYIKMIKNRFTIGKKLTVDNRIVYDITVLVERV
jgi:hypothetical protein